MLKKVIATLVLLCSCVMLVPSFESKASNDTYYIQYVEPTTSATQGYVALELQNNSTGVRSLNVFFWTLTPRFSTTENGNGEVYMKLIANSNQIQFVPSGEGTTMHCSISVIQGDSMVYQFYSGSGLNQTYTYAPNGFSIVGWVYKGNVGYVSGGFSMPVLVWGSERLVLDELNNIYNQLVQANANDTTMINKINQIYNSVDTVESKLQQLIDLQEETNTWLEKIFNYLNESQEKQKQEAQTQGNSSVSQGSSAIEDKGGDFAGSLSGLTNSMSYTGTDCSWTFPTVKLPAIPGVMDEVTLIESQPIDFTFWVNAIPSGIMLIIQSVLTIGLIVYCFKELYSTIAYVLTLRKDDNS